LILSRARALADRLPMFAGPLASAVAVGAIGTAVLFVLNGNYYDSVFEAAICYSIVAVGMVLQIGYTAQLAFSQSVFMGFGAYGVAVLNLKFGWNVPLAGVVVLAVALLLSALIGAVCTRAPGFSLALATLFFSAIAIGFVGASNYLGATTGLGGIGEIWTGGSFTLTLELSGLVAVVFLGGCVFVCGRIMNSTIGLELALMASDERMASSLGVITPRRKLEVFVLASGIATLGGVVYAGTQTFVGPDSFNQGAELSLLLILFLGGRRNLWGAVIAAVGIEYLSGTNNWIEAHLLIVEGVLFTPILLYAPNGVITLPGRLIRLAASKFSLRSKIAQTVAASPFGVAAIDPDEVRIASARSGAFGERLMAQSEPSMAPGASEDARLECRHLTKRFGGVVAVDDVSLAIRGFGIHAICGPNGAGKSTLFELVAGGHRPDHGQILIDGVDVTGTPPYERAQLGIARTLQSVRLMGGRSVLDNVAVAALDYHRAFLSHAVVHSDLRQARERAREAIGRVGIGRLASSQVGQMTLEGQRMVELARAIVAKPRLLMLDEPASGLGSAQRTRLAEILVELGNETTIVLVEHDLQMVAQISSEVFVLIDGELRFTGDADGFLHSEVVRTELMGLTEGEEAFKYV
jgi:branched-chain amino acid transport system permease protein